MKWFTSPKVMAKFHAFMTFAWVVTIVPTLLWWRESILWVAFMSLWANVISHAACWAAAKAEIAAGKNVLVPPPGVEPGREI